MDVQSAFLKKLRESRREEIIRGVSTIGPHRDEMRIYCNNVDLTDFGSRGQVRTAILSMKLAEVEWLMSKTGEYPVLLMDETLAELDQSRRNFLLQYLDQVDQALLTTTDLNLFAPDFVNKCERWQVTSGSVEALNHTH